MTVILVKAVLLTLVELAWLGVARMLMGGIVEELRRL